MQFSILAILKKLVKINYGILFCLLFSGSLFAKRNVNWEERLKDYEKQERRRYENPIKLEIKLSEIALSAWLGLRSRLKIFQSTCKALYDPTRSPFRKTIVNKNNLKSFDVITNHGSKLGKYLVQIKQMAKKDKISSKLFKKDTFINGAKFKIYTAGKVVNIDFSKGGKLQDLKSILDEASSNLYTVQILLVDSKHEILIISSKKSGLDNKIMFDGNENFLLEMGFLTSVKKEVLKKKNIIDKNSEDKKNKIKDFYLSFNKSKKEIFKGKYLINNENDKNINDSSNLKNIVKPIELIEIKPNSRILIRFPESMKQKIKPSTKINFEYKIKDIISLKKNIKKIKSIKKYFSIGFIDHVQINKIKIYEDYLIKKLNTKKNNLNIKINKSNKNIIQKNIFELDKKKSKNQYLKLFDSNLNKMTSAIFISKNSEKNNINNNNNKNNLSGKIILHKKNDNKKLNNNLKQEWKKISFNINKLNNSLNQIDAILMVNDLNQKSYIIRKLKIDSIDLKKLTRSKKEKKILEKNKKLKYNFIEKAQNSKLLFDGAEIYRTKNEINDLISGVNLKLLSLSDREEELKIEYDYPKIIELIQNFLDEYNNLMLYLKNITEFIPKLTLKYLEDEEENFKKKSYDEKNFMELSGEKYKGAVKGNFNIRFLKQQLRRNIMGSPYDYTLQKNIKFLTQIGFLNANESSQGVDLESLKIGYLVLDKKILELKLRMYFKEIRNLFAYSTPGSIIKDRGIAVNLVKLINSYSKKMVRDKNGNSRFGIIEVNKKTLERRIKEKNKRLVFIRKQVDRKINDFKKKIEKIKRVEEEREYKMNSLRNLNQRNDTR